MNADRLSTDTAFDRKPAPFLLRGAQKTVLTLRLTAPEDPSFMDELLNKIAHSPDFFRDAPLVFDVGPMKHRPPIDLLDLKERLEEHRLRPIGVQNGDERWNDVARAAGLALFAAGDRPSPNQFERKPAPPAASGGGGGSGMIVRDPVRGGQQIYNPEGDLVVLAAVGHGAEIVAAGNVHVYAPLRGRAFAGVDGDAEAMIFCDRLEAELVSIAGLHVVNEEIDRALVGKRARVSSNGKELSIASLP